MKRTDRIVKKPNEKTGSGNRLKAKQNRMAKFVAELLRSMGAMGC